MYRYTVKGTDIMNQIKLFCQICFYKIPKKVQYKSHFYIHKVKENDITRKMIKEYIRKILNVCHVWWIRDCGKEEPERGTDSSTSGWWWKSVYEGGKSFQHTIYEFLWWKEGRPSEGASFHRSTFWQTLRDILFKLNMTHHCHNSGKKLCMMIFGAVFICWMYSLAQFMNSWTPCTGYKK